MAKGTSGSREPAREQRRLARKEGRQAERRRKIMDAARKLLASKGIQNFTVSAVAAVAEVSKPAVYYYFASKDDLVLELATEALKVETEVTRRAIEAADDGVSALTGALRVQVDHYLADLDRYRILHVWTGLLALADRLVTSDVHRERAELDEALAQKLRQEQARGKLRSDLDPHQLVRVAGAVAIGMVAAAAGKGPAALHEPSAVRQLCDDACRLLQSGLQRKPD